MASRVAAVEARPIPPQVLTASATVAITNLANGASQASDCTITGAAIGDWVQVTATDAGSRTTTMTISARVTSANNVQVIFTNLNGASINFTSTLSFRITKA